jgi:hypothetical protein
MSEILKFPKYSFSGHESFQCRQLWLKRGYDLIASGKKFTDEDAVVDLGVGKNMVTSIKFWLRAFNIITGNDEITAFGKQLLDDDTGSDPYLEDDASLWLLHYQIIRSGIASTYALIFNELRRERLQFNKDQFEAFIKRKAEETRGLNFNAKTVRDDFDVFRKMYLAASSDLKKTEDSFSGLLSDLHLLTINGRGKDEYYTIENREREEVPVEVFLFAILDNESFGDAINLGTLENATDSPGAIFAMNRPGIVSKLQEAEKKYKWLTYRDHAGIKELQLKNKPASLEVLKTYYAVNI